MVASTSKKQAKAIRESIEKAQPSARIKYYDSDSTAKERENFNDVNAAWSEVDVVIYTSIILAGCSFELKHFDKVFAYFSDKSVCYKSSNQMLWRVRDVASKEHHIYIKESSRSANYLDTYEKVEKALACEMQICEVPTNPLDMMEKMVNTSGEFEFPEKNLYHTLHVGNILHRQQSSHRFRELFIRHYAMSGAQVVVREDEPTRELAMIEKVHNSRLVANNQLMNEKIASAKRLTSEDAEELRNAGNLSEEDKCALELYRLVNCYSLSSDIIAADVVGLYIKPNVMATFGNLHRVSMADCNTIWESVAKYRQLQTVDVGPGYCKYIDKLNPDHNLARCLFTVDLLDMLFDGYCKRHKIFVEAKILRHEFERRLKDVVKLIQDNEELVMLLFGARKSSIRKKQWTPKSVVALLNPFVVATFDLRLFASKSPTNNHASESFTLAPPLLFCWSKNQNKYIVNPPLTTLDNIT